MPIVPLPDLLAAAQEGGYAVGYFEAWDSYSLEAVVEAAEAERSPVVLGFGCAMVDGAWLDGGGIELLADMATHAAEMTTVPVSVLFNETHTLRTGTKRRRGRFQRGHGRHVRLCPKMKRSGWWPSWPTGPTNAAPQ